MSSSKQASPVTASSTSSDSKPAPPSTSSSRPSAGARPPSLTQLAARIAPNVAPTTGASPARSRLAANLLRTNSAVSSVSTTSAASGLTNHPTQSTDSIAVQAPSTRPVSPTASEISQAASNASRVGDTVTPTTATTNITAPLTGKSEGVIDAAGTGSAPPEDMPKTIVDREEKLIRGYKNIPSLDAITERMRRAKLEKEKDGKDGFSISVTGPSEKGSVPNTADSTRAAPPTADPTKAAEIVNEKAEVSQETNATEEEGEHPLQHTWTLYYDTKSKPPPGQKEPFTPFSAEAGQQVFPPQGHGNLESGAYEAGLTVVGEFKTVEGFCRYFNWLKPPSKLERSSNYHLFKDGIKPMWEDPANASGGKWVLTVKGNPGLLDRCWSWLAMALVGEELDERDEVCGAVVSLRAKVDRIQVWTRGRTDVERLNALGKKLIKLLDVEGEQTIGLEFQFNTDANPPPNKFLSVQSPTAYHPGGYRPSPLNATFSGNSSPFSPQDASSPASAVSSHGPTHATIGNAGPILPLKASNVAALDAATGSGGAFGAWRSKRAQGPGEN